MINFRHVEVPVSDNSSSRIIRFSTFEVNLHTGELRHRGQKVKLQEQPFQVLAALLERPGEVITREELRSKLWPADTFVDFDHSLNAAIKRLRDALGESADAPVHIETMARRGYRFMAPVTTDEQKASGMSAATATAALPAPQRGMLARAAAAGVVMVAILVVATYLYFSRKKPAAPATPPITSLAVLPLTNLSGDPNQEYFSDGMTDALITGLAQLGSIKVISRTSIMRYKKTDKSLPEIAHELNVDGIIEGTVQHSGDRVRITAQLIEGSTDRHVWANGYERDLRDVLALQDEVARAIAREIKIKLTPQDQTRLATARQVNPQAYEVYLKGRYDWNKMSGSSVTQAAEYFSKAIALDGNYAAAYVGLADCYVSLADVTGALPPSEAYGKAKEATLRALEIDNGLAEAHASLAVIRADYDWNWEGAETEFHRALELDPKDVNTLQWHAVFLARLGRFKEAFAEIGTAKELDPLSLRVATNEGEILRCARRYDEAIEELRRAIDLEPSFKFTHAVLARVYELKGMFREAAFEWTWVNAGGTYVAVRDAAGYERAMQVRLERLQEESKRQYVSPVALALAAAYAAVRDAAGYKRAMQVWLEFVQEESKRQYLSPMSLAVTYARLGNAEQTLVWLEEAYRDHAPGLSSLKVDPFFDFLRSDRRFQDLLRRMNFPP
jgi:TolB-like protein/DNA-binding winged helix-turn-helix (wHTH) protein